MNLPSSSLLIILGNLIYRKSFTHSELCFFFMFLFLLYVFFLNKVLFSSHPHLLSQVMQTLFILCFRYRPTLQELIQSMLLSVIQFPGFFFMAQYNGYGRDDQSDSGKRAGESDDMHRQHQIHAVRRFFGGGRYLPGA